MVKDKDGKWVLTADVAMARMLSKVSEEHPVWVPVDAAVYHEAKIMDYLVISDPKGKVIWRGMCAGKDPSSQTIMVGNPDNKVVGEAAGRSQIHNVHGMVAFIPVKV